jgi:hypothetical protein
MPIIKSARKKKHKYKKHIYTNTKQTDNQKNAIFQAEICKITGENPYTLKKYK